MFTVNFHRDIPLSALTMSTSIALESLYEQGSGDRGKSVFCIGSFLGADGKFSADEFALKKIMHSSTTKR